MTFTGQKQDVPARGEPECHTFAFVTTGATIEIATQLKVITGWSFGLQGTPATGEILSLDETLSDFGQVLVPSDGNVTIRRAATTTSALKGCVNLWGY